MSDEYFVIWDGSHGNLTRDDGWTTRQSYYTRFGITHGCEHDPVEQVRREKCEVKGCTQQRSKHGRICSSCYRKRKKSTGEPAQPCACGNAIQPGAYRQGVRRCATCRQQTPGNQRPTQGSYRRRKAA